MPRKKTKTVRKCRIVKKNPLTEQWEQKFLERIGSTHKRKKEVVVQRILKRVNGVRASLVTRSKKYEVECKATIEDLRELIYEAYGTPCKYCGRLMTIRNLVMDHTIPISKGGTSNKENLQIICKPCNTMKGSLEQENFDILLKWLKTIPEELEKDIRIRLARGLR